MTLKYSVELNSAYDLVICDRESAANNFSHLRTTILCFELLKGAARNF